MSQLLVLHSSARSSGSTSRQLTDALVARWRTANPAGQVVEHDLARQPLPHLSETMIGAFFTPAAQRSAEQTAIAARSQALIDELLAADTVIIGAPMYNFSLPSTLKAWIDQVVRAGVTFKYGENGPVGLVPAGKKVYVVTARGGVYSEGPAKAMDFHETYLRGVLGFIGLGDVEFLHNEGLGMGEEAVRQATERTRQRIEALDLA